MSRPRIVRPDETPETIEIKQPDFQVGLKNNIITGQLTGVLLKLGDAEYVCDPGNARSLALAIINAAYHLELANAEIQRQALQNLNEKIGVPKS